MELIINFYQLINIYKEVVASVTTQSISLNEALILHSVHRGRRTQTDIISHLEKNRSQIHRLLVKLVERGLLKKSSDSYSLTQKGVRVCQEVEEATLHLQRIATEREIPLKDLKRDVKLLKEALVS
ncbi:hypothetical protein PM10SUCC1_02300 [Propionigenium maris DSM 9537]|uniref:HVO-A0261-like N-terminal domain-containing protein n=1 Tax=Propionigenium maris DSM 9537 TaxID=1123000 RepID=A0A9W6GIC5_9FUSO|nr:winged helix-turn-helix domain-containing protein [Propionigenium maris]GLI54715.1 hypothetical protein PM10SUCC1_02300 [Propionigenium maris DSM 9537]